MPKFHIKNDQNIINCKDNKYHMRTAAEVTVQITDPPNCQLIYTTDGKIPTPFRGREV